MEKISPLNQADKQNILELFLEKKEISYTPYNLAELISKIGENYGYENAIDICCGTGRILHHLDKSKKLKGIDINVDLIQIARLINPEIDFIESDTLGYDFGNEKYDLVIGNLPLGQIVDRTPSKSLDVELIKKGLKLLSDNGVAIFVIHNGLLVNSNELKLRNDLINEFSLDMIISLPDRIFSYTGVKTSVLVIRNGNKNSDIFMPNFTDNASAIVNTFSNCKNDGEFYLSLSDIDEIFSLDKNYYSALKAANSVINGRETIKLSDISTVIKGKPLDRNEFSPEGTYFIFSRNLNTDSKKISIIPDKNCLLQKDDIVLSMEGQYVYLHQNENLNIVIPAYYVIIRTSNHEYTEYLNTYMQTELWKIQIKPYCSGTVMPQLKIDRFKNFRVLKLSKSELEDALLETLKKSDDDRYYTLNSQKCLQNGEYENAKNWIEKVKDQELKDAHLQNINNAEALAKKDKELEDMMSMFAHKFRSPLDAIIYNTNHENNPKLYIEAAQTMRGLLDVFSIISTDEKVLKGKIKTDNKGSSGLARVLSKTLNMILLHLLSSSGTDKIQQHYMAYAKAQGKINSSVTPKIWNEDYFELERTIQTEWEISFSELLSKSGSLPECLDWIEQHFFKLELIGFERNDIQFKEYSVTESFLTILFNEILVNAFKYYSSESNQSVVLELDERDGNQVIICRNPSVKRERTSIKGSGKGHVFLSALASKIGSIFFKPKPQDDFVVEFTIPNELLISN
ncbi:MAG: N-6 DNA methylase [Methylococcaceae bacterium]